MEPRKRIVSEDYKVMDVNAQELWVQQLQPLLKETANLMEKEDEAFYNSAAKILNAVPSKIEAGEYNEIPEVFNSFMKVVAEERYLKVSVKNIPDQTKAKVSELVSMIYNFLTVLKVDKPKEKEQTPAKKQWQSE